MCYERSQHPIDDDDDDDDDDVDASDNNSMYLNIFDSYNDMRKLCIE